MLDPAVNKANVISAFVEITCVCKIKIFTIKSLLILKSTWCVLGVYSNSVFIVQYLDDI